MTNPIDQPGEPGRYAERDVPAADPVQPGTAVDGTAAGADDRGPGDRNPDDRGPDELAPDPAAPPRPAPGFDQKGNVRRTRVSGVWIGLIGTALFLILLIVFIAQNSRQVPLHFFGWSGQFSLALTIVLSAVIGVLLVAIPGSVRILQLRRALRKNVPGDQRGAR